MNFTQLFNCIACFFIVTILLSSCQSIYLPTEALPTGFTEKGDKSVRVAAGTGGFSANAAYSPINNVFLQVGFNGFPSNTSAFSGGLGCYLPLKDSTLTFELQSSYGFGDFRFRDPLSGVGSSLTAANGTYKNGNLSASFVRHKRKNNIQQALLFRGGITNVYYAYINLDALDGNMYHTTQFGAYFLDRRRLFGNLFYYSSIGSYISTKDNSYIRTHSVELKLGFDYRF